MKNTFLAKTYTITLTLPKAIVFGVVSLILISWFFFLGLIVGRGYEPENLIPHMAQVMPQPGESGEAGKTGSDGQTSSASSSTTPSPPAGASSSSQHGENNGRVIIAEADKVYRANIKQDGSSPSVTTPPSLTPPKVTQPGAQSATQSTTQSASQTTSQSGESTTYKFVYQLASFKDEKAAQELKGKLAAAGFPARITTSKGAQSTWYRLIIDFTGTQSQADAARGALKKNFKLGEPLKLSQKKAG